MPRRAPSILGGYACPILNRANGPLRLFKKKADFAAFEDVLPQAFERVPLRILDYTRMGNHCHIEAVSTVERRELPKNKHCWPIPLCL